MSVATVTPLEHDGEPRIGCHVHLPAWLRTALSESQALNGTTLSEEVEALLVHALSDSFDAFVSANTGAPAFCRKRYYPSKRAAKLALQHVKPVRRLQGKLHIEAHTYRCPLCGGWHLTHLEPGKR